MAKGVSAGGISFVFVFVFFCAVWSYALDTRTTLISWNPSERRYRLLKW